MKYFFFVLITSVTFYNNINAQGSSDALRMSSNIYQGTARLQSMGSAFGALGGDFGSLSLNPGGLGIYQSNEFTFTPAVTYTNSESSYLKNKTDDFKYGLNLGNISYVASFSKKDEIKNLNFGIGYNRINDFTNRTFVSTNTANGSLLDEFVDYSNYGQGSHFYEDQAWLTDVLFIEDTLTNNYTNDFLFFADGNYGQKLNKSIETSGRIGEWVFAAAMNYSHKLYLGASLNIQSFKYNKTTSHTEITNHDIFSGHYEPDSFNLDYPYFKSFTFQESVNSYGTGINLKIGGIFRPVHFLRIGATIHTPTNYNVTNELSTEMTSVFYQGDPLSLSSKSDLSEYNYNVITPARSILSLALVYKKIGILSADYEYINYSSMRLRSDDDNFMDINEEIKNTYDKTHNIRVGAEIRYDIFSFRAGGAFYDNPYKNKDINEHVNILYTGGVGIRFESTYLDFAYVLSQKEYNHRPYLGSEIAEINENKHKFVTTVGFRF